MVFIETSIFTKEIKRLLPDEEYRALQGALLLSRLLKKRVFGQAAT
jgi:hypothetical protein